MTADDEGFCVKTRKPFRKWEKKVWKIMERKKIEKIEALPRRHDTRKTQHKGLLQ